MCRSVQSVQFDRGGEFRLTIDDVFFQTSTSSCRLVMPEDGDDTEERLWICFPFYLCCARPCCPSKTSSEIPLVSVYYIVNISFMVLILGEVDTCAVFLFL